jgi:hypothetical protein
MTKQTHIPALDRIKGETIQAYDARRRYILMGPERSSARVVKEVGKNKALIDRWCSRWGWVKLAQDYDDYAAQAEANAIVEERARLAKRAERARIAIPDHELSDAEELRKKAYDLLSLSHLSRKGKDDDTGAWIITPAHAHEFRAAKELIIGASDLSRRALGMPKESIAARITTMSTAELTNMVLSLLTGDDEFTQSIPGAT